MKFPTLAIAVALFVAPVVDAQKQGFAGTIAKDHNDFKKFESMSEADRMMEVTKIAWPECMTGALNDAQACEKHINEELAAMNLSSPVEALVIYTRTPESPTSNAWVIPLGDDGLCEGKYGDGRIWYDFEWCVDDTSSPLKDSYLIKKSKKLLPASKWSIWKMEENAKSNFCSYDSSNPYNNGGYYRRRLAEEDWTERKLQFRDPPDDFKRWLLSDIDQWRLEADKHVGGDFETRCSGYGEIDKMVKQVWENFSPDEGCQRLPELNCFGLSAIDTCKMIKEIVRYPNDKKQNIECFAQYQPSSPKHQQIIEDLISIGQSPKTKVVIIANATTKKVLSEPIMKGPLAQVMAK